MFPILRSVTQLWLLPFFLQWRISLLLLIRKEKKKKKKNNDSHLIVYWIYWGKWWTWWVLITRDLFILLGTQGVDVGQLRCSSGSHRHTLTTRNQKYWTQLYGEVVRFLGVGGNRGARRKPVKAGMESANQIHVQPLASCIGERKVYEH